MAEDGDVWCLAWRSSATRLRRRSACRPSTSTGIELPVIYCGTVASGSVRRPRRLDDASYGRRHGRPRRRRPHAIGDPLTRAMKRANLARIRRDEQRFLAAAGEEWPPC